MNTSDPGFNLTFSSTPANITFFSVTTSGSTIPPSIPPSIPPTISLTIPPNISATISLPPSYSSDIHDPEFTIMVVLGLSLLLAGVAAFLAVCRPSEQDADTEASCSPGESLTRGKSRSSEPQLKVWKRLGSYRRSYHLSFRRPPHRRPHQRGSSHASQSPARRTPQPEASVEPHLIMPCLFDYVTEI